MVLQDCRRSIRAEEVPVATRNCGLFLVSVCAVARAAPGAAPDRPGLDYVVPFAQQSYHSGPDVIWHDSFDSGQVSAAYCEHGDDNGDCVPVSYQAFGGSGYSLRARFQQGEVGAGGVKLVFGDSPVYSSRRLRPGEFFDDLYWRVYVKHQRGWTRNPAKMSRATSFARSDWSQAMIAHVWGGKGDVLCIDPASGIDADTNLATSGYNDFPNLDWLGLRNATFPVFSTAESGQWICVEARVRLNTPGQADGVFTLWIDGTVEAHRDDLNWTRSWRDYGINAVFLENYWNSGSPVEQERFFDDYVVSTAPVGLARCPVNPTVVKTPFSDPDTRDLQSGWQLQVAADAAGADVCWDSGTIAGAGNSVVVDSTNGTFTGTLAGRTSLAPEAHYWARVRQRDSTQAWSAWSSWRGVVMTGPGGPPTRREVDAEVRRRKEGLASDAEVKSVVKRYRGQ
jgi:hypothetical protein